MFFVDWGIQRVSDVCGGANGDNDGKRGTHDHFVLKGCLSVRRARCDER